MNKVDIILYYGLLYRSWLVDVVRLDVSAVMSSPLGLILTLVTLHHNTAVFTLLVTAEIALVCSPVVTLSARVGHALVYWGNVLPQALWRRGFVITLIAGILHSFMLRPHVELSIISPEKLLVTLLTVLSQTFMFGLDVILETDLRCGLIFTFKARISYFFMLTTKMCS